MTTEKAIARLRGIEGVYANLAHKSSRSSAERAARLADAQAIGAVIAAVHDQRQQIAALTEALNNLVVHTNGVKLPATAHIIRERAVRAGVDFSAPLGDSPKGGGA